MKPRVRVGERQEGKQHFWTKSEKFSIDKNWNVRIVWVKDEKESNISEQKGNEFSIDKKWNVRIVWVKDKKESNISEQKVNEFSIDRKWNLGFVWVKYKRESNISKQKMKEFSMDRKWNLWFVWVKDKRESNISEQKVKEFSIDRKWNLGFVWAKDKIESNISEQKVNEFSIDKKWSERIVLVGEMRKQKVKCVYEQGRRVFQLFHAVFMIKDECERRMMVMVMKKSRLVQRFSARLARPHVVAQPGRVDKNRQEWTMPESRVGYKGEKDRESNILKQKRSVSFCRQEWQWLNRMGK